METSEKPRLFVSQAPVDPTQRNTHTSRGARQPVQQKSIGFAEVSRQNGWKQFLFVGVALALVGVGCTAATESPNDNSQPDLSAVGTEQETPMNGFPGLLPSEEISGKVVRIATAKGDIVFELYSDTAPKTVSNFVALAKNGFYNGLTFHRRQEGFVIQGGDPNGNGTGGPGYTFEDELDDSYTYDRGMVAMANRGADTNGSQFFIMLADYPLPKQYTIFGKVLLGMEVVDQIQVGDVMTTVTVEDKQEEAVE